MCYELPMESTTVNMDEINRTIDKADDDAKVKRKAYADNRRVAKEPGFKIGDQVLVRQRKINKLTPRFKPKPYRITAIKGTMITARRPNHVITRNCSYFKIFGGYSRADDSSTDTVEEYTDDDNIETDRENEEDTRRKEPEQREDRRYPARQRNRPLFYREEQLIK